MGGLEERLERIFAGLVIPWKRLEVSDDTLVFVFFFK